MTSHEGLTGRGRILAAGLIALALLCAPMLAPEARAQGKAGKEIEAWVGYYEPDPSAMDADTSYGLRSIFRRPDGLGFGIEIGYVSASGEAISGGVASDLDWDAFFVDGVFDFPIGHGTKVIPAFTFGTGFAFSSVDASADGRVGSVDVDDLEDTTFTAQAGFGVKFNLGPSCYIRPAARLRWFEARSSEDLDTEYLIGFGKSF